MTPWLVTLHVHSTNPGNPSSPSNADVEMHHDVPSVTVDVMTVLTFSVLVSHRLVTTLASASRVVTYRYDVPEMRTPVVLIGCRATTVQLRRALTDPSAMLSLNA